MPLTFEIHVRRILGPGAERNPFLGPWFSDAVFHLLDNFFQGNSILSLFSLPMGFDEISVLYILLGIFCVNEQPRVVCLDWLQIPF